MGTFEFEFFPFLIAVLIPWACMAAVLVLAMTRRRSSILQLVLSLITLLYGITYAGLLRRSAGFSPWLALYGLPLVTGGLGVLLWLRSRRRR